MAILTLPVTAHTKYVSHGSTYVVIKGEQTDGADYIGEAIDKGAQTIVVQKDHQKAISYVTHLKARGLKIKYVSNARLALAQLSASAWSFPAKKITCIGITGTKGKSTSCFLLEHVLRKSGYRTALISSIYNGVNGKFEKAELTTPQSDYLQAFLSDCIQRGVTHVIIEVSAQALSLYRLIGIEFDVVLYTNFSPAHGEFYSSEQDYFLAKSKLLNYLKEHATIFVNGDDERLKPLIQDKKTVRTFGFSASNNICAQLLINDYVSINLYNYMYACQVLIGKFNAYNILGVIAISHLLGIENKWLAHAITEFQGVPGRMQIVHLPHGVRCVIDKAHDPSSFRAALPILANMGERLILVFGAGGQRDRSMRPAMGAIAAQYASQIILTTDDPRYENPAAIMDDIYAGIPRAVRHNVLLIEDRRCAIIQALHLASAETVIAILGKGSETYQEIAGVKHHFDERAIVLSTV